MQAAGQVIRFTTEQLVEEAQTGHSAASGLQGEFKMPFGKLAGDDEGSTRGTAAVNGLSVRIDTYLRSAVGEDTFQYGPKASRYGRFALFPEPVESGCEHGIQSHAGFACHQALLSVVRLTV